jgi:hypothetical protein
MPFDSKKIEELLEEPVILAMIMVPILIIVIQSMFESRDKRRKKPINLTYKKKEAKVVDKVDCGEIEALAEFKVCFFASLPITFRLPRGLTFSERFLSSCSTSSLPSGWEAGYVPMLEIENLPVL